MDFPFRLPSHEFPLSLHSCEQEIHPQGGSKDPKEIYAIYSSLQIKRTGKITMITEFWVKTLINVLWIFLTR